MKRAFLEAFRRAEDRIGLGGAAICVALAWVLVMFAAAGLWRLVGGTW